MKKYLIPFVAVCLIAIIVGFVRQTPLQKGIAQTVIFYQQATNTAVGCGNASSTLLLATSTGSRTYFRLSNTGGKDEYIGFGVPASTSTGLWLQASTSYSLGDLNVVYGGPLYCMAVGGNSTTTVLTIP